MAHALAVLSSLRHDIGVPTVKQRSPSDACCLSGGCAWPAKLVGAAERRGLNRITITSRAVAPMTCSATLRDSRASTDAVPSSSRKTILNCARQKQQVPIALSD